MRRRWTSAGSLTSERDRAGADRGGIDGVHNNYHSQRHTGRPMGYFGVQTVAGRGQGYLPLSAGAGLRMPAPRYLRNR